MKEICSALKKKGKRVCLATIAAVPGLGEDTAAKVNKLIQEYATKSANYDDEPIIVGPMLDAPIFRRPDTRCFDGFHLNSKVRGGA